MEAFYASTSAFWGREAPASSARVASGADTDAGLAEGGSAARPFRKSHKKRHQLFRSVFDRIKSLEPTGLEDPQFSKRLTGPRFWRRVELGHEAVFQPFEPRRPIGPAGEIGRQPYAQLKQPSFVKGSPPIFKVHEIGASLPWQIHEARQREGRDGQ